MQDHLMLLEYFCHLGLRGEQGTPGLLQTQSSRTVLTILLLEAHKILFLFFLPPFRLEACKLGNSHPSCSVPAVCYTPAPFVFVWGICSQMITPPSPPPSYFTKWCTSSSVLKYLNFSCQTSVLHYAVHEANNFEVMKLDSGAEMWLTFKHFCFF